MVFDGVVLRGQAEGVKAHGEEDVIAVHPLFPGDDVHGRVGPGVAHMEPLARGIGELDKAIELGLVAVVRGCVDLGVLPFFLPFGLNGGEIILQNESHFLL